MKRQKVRSLALLLVEMLATLFLAGIVAPSLCRSEFAAKEALAAGSLLQFNIAGDVFSYTRHNIEFAILGGLVGAPAAIAIHLRATTPRSANSTSPLQATLLRH